MKGLTKYIIVALFTILGYTVIESCKTKKPTVNIYNRVK